jgi:solute carrier family 25 thiamine pyrophosphate transporter 19
VSLRRYHQQRGGERLVVGVATVTAATTMMSCVTHTCKCEAASSSNDGIMNNNENKNNKNNNKNNSSNAIVAGAFAGAVARIFVAPLDVIKIRLQIQKENYSLTNAKYKGAVSAMATIAREEGIRKGLWAGTLPALCLWIPYTGIQFGMLNLLLTSSSSSSGSSSSSSNFVYGAVAGATATIATYPFDIIRTQLASQGIPKTYNGVFDAFYGLLRRRKLYAGLGITLIEIVPATSVQFGVYGYLDNKMNSDKNSKNHFAKGFIAGSCARVAIHPLDVMKKRLQVVGLKRAASYGAAETAHKAFPLVVSILKTEGPRGFYKGLLPALCKSAPSSAITFGVYEFAIRFLDNQQL